MSEQIVEKKDSRELTKEDSVLVADKDGFIFASQVYFDGDTPFVYVSGDKRLLIGDKQVLTARINLRWPY